MQIQYTQTKQMKPWQVMLFGLIFVIIGIGLLIFSVSTITSYNQKNKTYIEINSVVVDYDYNSEGLEAIIVEYKVDGQTYRKTSNSYSNIPKSKGTQVKVKYNPDNPSDAIWVNDSTNIVLPLMGVLFTLVGIIIVINSTKKIKDEKNTPMLEQPNGLFNRADVVNPITNNQNIESQQEVQNQQISQYQQFINQQQSQVQNIDYSNIQQNQINNQNNNNSNL